MKKLCSCLVAAGLAALATSPARAVITRHDVPDSDYVVGDADYPALVDLFDGKSDCIGALIHESYLLTVAHCAVDLKEGQSLKVKGAPHRIAEIIRHPRWRRRRNEHDIALVRLAEPVAGVAPLPLYRKTEELGSVVTMVGRGVHATGLQGERGAKSDGKLRKATNVVSAVDGHFLEIVFRRPGESGVTALEGVGASGDSGGPAFIEVGGVPHIAGLNSWGDGKGGVRVGQYGARDYQTRVSRYLEWIDESISCPDCEE